MELSSIVKVVGRAEIGAKLSHWRFLDDALCEFCFEDCYTCGGNPLKSFGVRLGDRLSIIPTPEYELERPVLPNPFGQIGSLREFSLTKNGVKLVVSFS
jgi:hypothetical protein